MATINLTQTDNDTLDTSLGAACSGLSLTAGSGMTDDAVDGGTPGVTEQAPAMVNSESNLILMQFTSDAINETVWAAGNYEFRLDVTSSSSFLSVTEIHVCRVNSSNVSQESLGSLLAIGRALSSVQVESFTISGSAATSPLATDRIQIVVSCTNSSTHGGDDAVGITPSQNIDTPIVRSVGGFQPAWAKDVNTLIDGGLNV